MHSKATPDRADILLLTALDEEHAGLNRVFDIPFERRMVDGTSHLVGRLERGDRSLDLVAINQLDRGPVAAAVTATKALCHWRPSIVAMTGICAGLRGVCELGDLVVATQCFEHSTGHLIDGLVRSERTHLPMAPWLQEYLQSIAADPALAPRLVEGYDGSRPQTGAPAIRFGAMASGSVVVKDSRFMSDLAASERSLVALDMESYGIALAAALCSSALRPVQAVVVKTVVDFADETKDDAWHEYGVFLSSALAKAFIERTLEREAAYANIVRGRA